jgi:hypothetical protein
MANEFFASVGKRVMRDYDYAEGTVIEDLGQSTVAVKWDDEAQPTLIYTFQLEPVE